MDTIELIKALRDRILEAEKMECKCSGFELQYNQGCECEKGWVIKAAKEELEKIIYGL